jgi:hypothetical protein
MNGLPVLLKLQSGAHDGGSWLGPPVEANSVRNAIANRPSGMSWTRSVHEWSMRLGWGGRPVRQEQAQGILIAALGVLAAHYGYGEARRAS